jgi:3-oxoacyl-[acyl-carrier-protein] synthase-1
MKDVIVSGMGIVSALGNGVDETLAALQAQKTGIGDIQYLQTIHKDFPVGEVKYDEDELRALLSIDAEQISTRTALLGMLALKEALQQSHLQDKKGLRVALISGTTVGGMDKSEQYYVNFLEDNTQNAYIAAHDCGSCTEMIADKFGGFSLLSTISTACSSAANAIILAADLIKQGRVDVAIAGGAECLTKFHLNGFNTLMILDRNICRPFDRDRAGLNLGEGAAYLVLETVETANRRVAKPLCKLSGYANTCDAYHQTASSPDGKGAYLSMKKALEHANLKQTDIGYINAHGTGTENNDLSEGNAIMQLFTSNIPPMSSTKMYTGHTTSAAGGVESVISILALLNDFIPANLNFKNKIEEHSFEPIHGKNKICFLTHVLNNSFGFGGNDTSLIFSKLD